MFLVSFGLLGVQYAQAQSPGTGGFGIRAEQISSILEEMMFPKITTPIESVITLEFTLPSLRQAE